MALRLLLLHLQPVHLPLLGPSLGPDDVGDDAGQEEGHHVAAKASHHETDGSLDPRSHLGSQCHYSYSSVLQLLHDKPEQQQQVGNIYLLFTLNIHIANKILFWRRNNLNLNITSLILYVHDNVGWFVDNFEI